MLHSFANKSPFFLLLTITSLIPQTFCNLYSDLIYQKYATVAARVANPTTYPHTANTQTGVWGYAGADWWTSGFFPGTLYLLNTRAEKCGSFGTDWLGLGRRWNRAIIPLLNGNTVGHDTGFLSFPFVEELELNPNNQTARDVVNGFARLLANRYSSIVGCTKSWDSSNPQDFQVIIDNMMNLEVLFISAGLTGNQTLRDIAISHADKTLENHLRSDGSSYHVVNYNAYTGAVTAKRTAQGYANESTWARGQAWGIYGFAMMYSYTRESRYLDAARKMASLFLQRLPANGIPPWDFDAPDTSSRPWDTSSGTIAATGLIYIAQGETFKSNYTGAQYWSDAAVKLLSDITSSEAWRPTWESILANGTSNYPQGNVRTGLVYGDYYLVKAGNLLLDMGVTECPTDASVERRDDLDSVPLITDNDSSKKRSIWDSGLELDLHTKRRIRRSRLTTFQKL